MIGLYNNLFYPKEIEHLFTDSRQLAFMLQAEATLSQAQAEHNVIPKSAAQVITGCCHIELFDIERIKKEIPIGGNAAIPLVKQLVNIVKSNDFEASKYVHFGATSQDIIDTATMLFLKEYSNWLDNKLYELLKLLEELTETHRNTLMIGRTLLQQAKPVTFGLKTAFWLESIARNKSRIAEAGKETFRIQLAGAVGSGTQTLNYEVCEEFAKLLDLSPSFSWQSERDIVVHFMALLGVLNGSLGKIAKDISLLMQTEIAEVFEGKGEGKGGSSTMSHKRNPVTCTAIIANAARVPQLVATLLSVMPQENERSAGLWHAEWEPVLEIAGMTAGSLEKTVELIANLEVNREKMLQNLEVTNGLIYAENVTLALAQKIGRLQAHEYVEKACKTAIQENKHLKQVLEEGSVAIDDLQVLFLPQNSLGFSLEIVDRILKNFKKYENIL